MSHIANVSTFRKIAYTLSAAVALGGILALSTPAGGSLAEAAQNDQSLVGVVISEVSAGIGN